MVGAGRLIVAPLLAVVRPDFWREEDPETLDLRVRCGREVDEGLRLDDLLPPERVDDFLLFVAMGYLLVNQNLAYDVDKLP